MEVLVTGAGGLVGAHTVAALAREPRRFTIRALARDRARLLAALAPLGVTAEHLEIVLGDVTDEAAVRAAVSGADAVIHAAGLYSHDVNDAARMHETNVLGTRCVLEAAVAAGADPVVHVSSYLALFPPGGSIQRASPAPPEGNQRRQRLQHQRRAELTRSRSTRRSPRSSPPHCTSASRTHAAAASIRGTRGK